MKYFCSILMMLALLAAWPPPAPARPADPVEATVEQLIADFDLHVGKVMDVSFNEKDPYRDQDHGHDHDHDDPFDLPFRDMPGYRDRLVRVPAVTADSIDVSPEGVARARVAYKSGGREQDLYFYFDGAGPEAMIPLMNALFDRRPLAIVGTVVSPEVNDILIRNCVLPSIPETAPAAAPARAPENLPEAVPFESMLKEFGSREKAEANIDGRRVKISGVRVEYLAVDEEGRPEARMFLTDPERSWTGFFTCGFQRDYDGLPRLLADLLDRRETAVIGSGRYLGGEFRLDGCELP